MIALLIAVFVTVTSGAYLALSKDVFRAVVGLSVLGAATNLLLFAAGRMSSRAPAVVPQGETVLTHAADPLPQALVLTAIVIGFAVVCFALVLLMRVMKSAGTDDALQMRYAEPIPDEGTPKPPYTPPECDPPWSPEGGES